MELKLAGLSRLYLNRNLNLRSNNENLANSNADGRMARSSKREKIKEVMLAHENI
jgi:hypothetical protein